MRETSEEDFTDGLLVILKTDEGKKYANTT